MKKAPFPFILDALASLDLQIKPMFGAHALFKGGLILMILRKKTTPDSDTGIWFAFPDEHIADVKKEFPVLKNIGYFGSSPASWQIVRESEENFEGIVLSFCELILKNDPRFGRIHKAKPPKKKKMVIPKKIKVKDNQ